MGTRRYTQVHAGTRRYTQVHAGTRRYPNGKRLKKICILVTHNMNLKINIISDRKSMYPLPELKIYFISSKKTGYPKPKS